MELWLYKNLKELRGSLPVELFLFEVH